MVVNMKNPPTKPKRRFLPLSLSFDDGEERRRRFQKRLKNKEANNGEMLHRSPNFCRTYASITLNNRKVEIPYIDADPLNLPHAATLLSPAKDRVKPRRNHAIRPKSMIDTNEEMLRLESSYNTEIPPKMNDFPTDISPAVISYAEWKRQFDQKNEQQYDDISTPINTPKESQELNSEKLHRKKTISREAYKANPDSPIQRLKKKVWRSRSIQPPNLARRRMTEDTKWRALAHAEEGANERRKKLHRCNSESIEKPTQSESVNMDKEYRTRAKLLKNSEHDSQCSNSSNGSAERSHKNSWLSSAGKIKSAFSRAKKQQQSCESKVDTIVCSNGDTWNSSRNKSHSLSAEKEITEAATQCVTISLNLNVEQNSATTKRGDQKQQENNVSNESLTARLNETNRRFQESGATKAEFTTLKITSTVHQLPKKETPNKPDQLTPPFMERRNKREKSWKECAKVEQKRPSSQSSCYDPNGRMKARLCSQRSASISSINELGINRGKMGLDSSRPTYDSHTNRVAEIAKIFSK